MDFHHFLIIFSFNQGHLETLGSQRASLEDMLKEIKRKVLLFKPTIPSHLVLLICSMCRFVYFISFPELLPSFLQK